VNSVAVRRVCGLLCVSLLQMPAGSAAPAAHEAVELRAYVDDSCIIADEPFFLPVSGNADQGTAKFLPLIGLIVGKLAELFVNHQIQASANRIKSGAVRKDTRYAVIKEMSLYRADFQPVPVLGINAKLGCMTIVAADFKPEPAQCTAEYLPKELTKESRDLPQNEWQTSRTDGSIENQLRRANVCVNGKARAVYEARFEISKDGTAYRLKDAGYHIEGLLTTSDKGASRATVYTLKISNPGATDQQEVLSSAWINIGMVTAGSHAGAPAADKAPWLRVPPMSNEARRVYEEKTKVQQDVSGEIEALRRALTRNQRMLAGLDQRITTAAADTAEGLRQERTRVAVQIQTQEAELDARKAEYQDLPRTPMEFMPVTIEVAVTETESEKKAQLALADIIGQNGGLVGSAVGGLFSKSVALTDINTDTEPAHDLESARAAYYDALVEAQSNAAGKSGDAQRKLAAMKDKYNEARRSQGLEPVK
jgi:hypothetical protein